MITICDTGPLVAYLNANDTHHAWAVSMMKQVPPPMVTSEAVLTEAVDFLRDEGLDLEPLLVFVERGALRVDFDFEARWPRVRMLMSRYTRMDLADATIVAMTEVHRRCQVLTVDRKDFAIYRRNDRQVIPFVAPPT